MIVIKGSSWKWVDGSICAGCSINDDRRNIELVAPTSEEIGQAGIADSFLIRINSMDSLLIPLQMKHEIVAILKEEGKCGEDKVQDLLKQISDITEKIAEHQNNINNAILQFLKAKER